MGGRRGIRRRLEALVNSWKWFRASIVAAGGLMLSAFLLAGCEGGGGGDDEDLSVNLDETTNSVVSPDDLPTDTSTPEDPNFPDGLHPSAEASETIAKVFASQISPVSDAGGNDTNAVVCFGDSITARYYPPYLADRIEMNVINEGKGGELSGSGAARIGDVLAEHRPAYICILEGINDISGADATVAQVVANLESMVNAAKANGTIPIVGTLTPLSGSRKEWAADGRAASAAIREMVGRTGARLADVEAAF